MKHPDLRDKQAVMRMEPGWLPYRRNAGQAVSFGGEARQLETQAVMI